MQGRRNDRFYNMNPTRIRDLALFLEKLEKESHTAEVFHRFLLLA